MILPQFIKARIPDVTFVECKYYLVGTQKHPGGLVMRYHTNTLSVFGKPAIPLAELNKIFTTITGPFDNTYATTQYRDEQTGAA